MSITVEVEDAILPAGSNPVTASLKAVLHHPSLIVDDILSNIGVEFESTFAITLRPKCTKIPDGIQINWRAFMKQNLSLFNNISVRFPSAHQNSSKSNFHPVLQQPHQQQQSHQQQQQHIVSTLTPMAQLIPQRDHQVHTSLNLSALDPAVLASRLADSHLQDMPVCTTNQLHISHVASSIGNSPSNVYAPGMEVVFSTSMWQPSTTGVFSSDSLMPVHVQQHQQQAQQQYPHHQQHQEAQHAPLTSSYLKSTATTTTTTTRTGFFREL